MDYQGRSPLKDITRSVVLGAAMIPASLLASCGNSQTTAEPPPPTGTSSGGSVLNAADAGTENSDATDAVTVVQAPPPEVVRPRQNPESPGRMMPTRGFSGGSRVRV